jgi:hypothetical protein
LKIATFFLLLGVFFSFISFSPWVILLYIFFSLLSVFYILLVSRTRIFRWFFLFSCLIILWLCGYYHFLPLKYFY